MHIAVLTLRFSLPGCRSLKEKRHRLSGFHERFGRNPSVAVCESADRGILESAEWSFVVTANSMRSLDSLCTEIERKVQSTVDGRIIEVTSEALK